MFLLISSLKVAVWETVWKFPASKSATLLESAKFSSFCFRTGMGALLYLPVIKFTILQTVYMAVSLLIVSINLETMLDFALIDIHGVLTLFPNSFTRQSLLDQFISSDSFPYSFQCPGFFMFLIPTCSRFHFPPLFTPGKILLLSILV